MLRRFVSLAIADATGVAIPNRAQLASAFDLRCRQLRARLRPVFGAAAIDALFARALDRATAEFPWLSGVIEDGERCSLEALETVSGTMEPSSVAEGLAAVFANDIELLTTFIGEDFVMPLVQEAWGSTVASEWTARSEGDHE